MTLEELETIERKLKERREGYLKWLKENPQPPLHTLAQFKTGISHITFCLDYAEEARCAIQTIERFKKLIAGSLPIEEN